MAGSPFRIATHPYHAVIVAAAAIATLAVTVTAAVCYNTGEQTLMES
jgi:hypothetical protein